MTDKLQIPDKYKGPKYYYGLCHSGRTHSLTEEEAMNLVIKEMKDLEMKRGYKMTYERGLDCDGTFVRAIEEK